MAAVTDRPAPDPALTLTGLGGRDGRDYFSRGRPSPRWAMMVRWISLVPP